MASRRSREVLGLLPLALAELARRQVDFLAVTGDLIDAPNEVLQSDGLGGLAAAEKTEEAQADYRRIKAALDGSGIPYMVLPGNHDLEPAMWRVFDPQANVVGLEQAPWRVARFCDREGAGHVPRRLGAELLLWERLLDSADPRPQVHLQHYIVAPKIGANYPHNYLEHEDIRQRTSASGRVALSLSGHCHQGTDLIRVEASWFAAAPAFSDFPHPFRVYEIEPNGASMDTLHP